MTKDQLKRKAKKAALVLIVLAVIAFKCMSTTYEVVKVYDGDTLTAMIGGKRESVRLAYIDTPEMDGPNLGLAIAARDSLKSWTLGKWVEIDIQAKRGYWGRLIGTVYVDGEDVGIRLMKLGLARKYVSGKKW